MNVAVKLNDGLIIYPSYAPEHKLEVLGFYAQQYWAGLIKGYKATLEDGSIVAVGAY